MGAKATKAAGNLFYKARIDAAKYNDKLKSREGAAEALGYSSSSTIADWELGITLPSPESVLKMADLYNCPELMNQYCTSVCPLGDNIPKCEMEDIDRITVKALAVMRKVNAAKDMLLDITEDGVISDAEKPELQEILDTLDSLEAVTQSLKLWVKKNVS